MVRLPPGVPLVSLCVGLSASVYLCLWGAVACADPGALPQEIQEDRRQAEQGGMAVTTPELLRPHGLTVTVSQVPRGRPAGEAGWGGREVAAQPVPGEHGHPCSSASPTSLQGHTYQIPTSCSPGPLLAPTPKSHSWKVTMPFSSPRALHLCPHAQAAPKPQVPGHRDIGRNARNSV